MHTDANVNEYGDGRCVVVAVMVLTESVVGVEAACESSDRVEHVEPERAAKLGGQAEEEARPLHQLPPDHRRDQRELLRRRGGAPHHLVAAGPAPTPRPAERRVLVVPRRGPASRGIRQVAAGRVTPRRPPTPSYALEHREEGFGGIVGERVSGGTADQTVGWDEIT